MRIETQEISQRDSFQYLVSVISKDIKIEDDDEHTLEARWLKWKFAFIVLRDLHIPTTLKEIFTGHRPDQLSPMEQNIGQLRSTTCTK